jgi:ornithine cyclodeaminase/alanine dehydrogenase-like protein (mu-crystallin family)
MFIFRGLGLADLAVAGLVYKKAISHNVGTFLNA